MMLVAGSSLLWGPKALIGKRPPLFDPPTPLGLAEKSLQAQVDGAVTVGIVTLSAPFELIVEFNPHFRATFMVLR